MVFKCNQENETGSFADFDLALVHNPFSLLFLKYHYANIS